MRTYGAIRRIDDGWEITRLEPHVSIRLKALFGSIKKTSRPPYRLTGGPRLDADLDWFLSRYPLEIEPADQVYMQARRGGFEQAQAELGRILSTDWQPSSDAGWRGNARPWVYQSQAAEMARRTGRLLLMDEMGLGKTVSAIATVIAPDYLPALIVPQTHLPAQWAEKVTEFTTLRWHIIKKTKPYELPRADVYICPYSKLHGWIDYAQTAGFKSVIFDEIQELRNGRSTAKGAAASAFAEQSRLVMGLSGTPIYNYGSEIWNVVEFLEPGALGSFIDFTQEWCTPRGGHWVVDDPQALGTYLREQHLALRRTRHDVGHERAFPNTLVHDVPYDDSVLDAEALSIAALAQQVVTGSFHERGVAAREFDLRLRHATGVAKAPHVARFVEMLLASGEPVLLCGWHRDVYDIWLRELAAYGPALYTGSESPKRKADTVRAFTSGATNLMIMSLRSGAGLDGLQERCRTIVFGELDWSPKVHEQCIARLDRPGQKHQVDAVYLVADGGSDPSVVGVLGLKASQSHGIIDPMAAPMQQTSDPSRIRALAERYLQARSDDQQPSAPVPRSAPVEAQASFL